MDLDRIILDRVRAAAAWDHDAKLEDFQLIASENGSVLVNLRTRRAQLIYDDESEPDADMAPAGSHSPAPLN